MITCDGEAYWALSLGFRVWLVKVSVPAPAEVQDLWNLMNPVQAAWKGKGRGKSKGKSKDKSKSKDHDQSQMKGKGKSR